MSNFSFRRPNRGGDMTTASSVFNECHAPIEQLVMELKPERKVKGALGLIASEADMSYSKVRRIFYRLTDHILAHERDRLKAAVRRIALEQEKRIEARLNNIRAIRAEREDLVKQFEIRI